MKQHPGTLTPKQAAGLLGIHTNTLGQWARDGKIAAIETTGGKRRYRPEDVNEYLNARPKALEVRMADSVCPNCLRLSEEKNRLYVDLKDAERRAAESQHPDLQDVIGHCEDGSCGVHKQEWESLKRQLAKDFLDDLSDDYIRDTALSRGLFPSRIRISS